MGKKSLWLTVLGGCILVFQDAVKTYVAKFIDRADPQGDVLMHYAALVLPWVPMAFGVGVILFGVTGLLLPVERQTDLALAPATIAPAPTPAARRATSQFNSTRDTKLDKAFAYIEGGEWMPWEDYVAIRPDDRNVGHSIDQVRQVASDDRIHLWGKPNPKGVYEEIHWSFWAENVFEYTQTSTGDVRTASLTSRSYGQRYYMLMVSKDEVERIWPHRV